MYSSASELEVIASAAHDPSQSLCGCERRWYVDEGSSLV
jgi:hypothetical protein